MTQSRGEYRVGIDFNPSADDMVGRIKRAAADLIDLIDELKGSVVDHGSHREATFDQRHMEVERCKALAQTHVEDAAMWAVKAATKPAPKIGEAS